MLVRQLLQNQKNVVVLDNLMYGGEPLLDFFNYPNFTFIHGDIRNPLDVEKALEGVTHVAHLAAIVGDPACAKNPDLSKSTNIDGAKLLYETACRKGVSRFVFASTCSNYGKMKDPSRFIDENSELAPLSLYSETKVEFEKFLMSKNNQETKTIPTILRFATVYGLSLRPRFDLTVNEFTKELALGRELVIFGEQFWRPYCHVEDLARSVLAVFNAPDNKVAFNVFNVGDTEENYQKIMLVDEIKKMIPDAKVKYVQKNEDPRDYRVNFSKIQEQLGFKITKKVPDGISQILQVVKFGLIRNPDHEQYRNI